MADKTDITCKDVTSQLDLRATDALYQKIHQSYKRSGVFPIDVCHYVDRNAPTLRAVAMRPDLYTPTTDQKQLYDALITIPKETPPHPSTLAALKYLSMQCPALYAQALEALDLQFLQTFTD